MLTQSSFLQPREALPGLVFAAGCWHEWQGIVWAQELDLQHFPEPIASVASPRLEHEVLLARRDTGVRFTAVYSNDVDTERGFIITVQIITYIVTITCNVFGGFEGLSIFKIERIFSKCHRLGKTVKRKKEKMSQSV